MAHSELETASEHLHRAAAVAAGDRSRRLGEQAKKMADLAAADRGADHGRLARHEHVLREIAEEADDDVVEAIEAALDEIHAFRETVEGV